MPSATQFIKMSVFHLLLFPLAWPVFHDDGARRSNRRWLADVTPAFPSIRDVSWHDIVGVKRLAGYSWILYGARQKAVVGDLLNAIKPIDYEHRAALAFGATFPHLGA